MIERVKVSVVSYLNSKPFIYGIENSQLLSDIDLQLDIPSVCAQKLIDGRVDIGLVPVAIIPLLKEAHVITDYCIGAVGKVASVCLYSEVDLPFIQNIVLDYQSRTSITLVQVLAKKFWKINPQWIPASENYESKVKGTAAAVIIGDRTFGLEHKFPYKYDLAEEWYNYTGLPFVFACWVANKQLFPSFLNEFNKVLKHGIENRKTLIEQIKNGYTINVEDYLMRSISYEYDDAKKQALRLFLEELKHLQQ